jgi:hypothetical protein
VSRAAIAAIFAVASLYPGVGTAGTPRYADVVLSDAKDGKAASTFTPATPKLFVRANIVDVPVGAKVKGEWIAVKTAVAPVNYKIDAREMTVFKNMTRVDYSMTRPNKGWPEGDYRVDMYIDGKKAMQVTFKVAK